MSFPAHIFKSYDIRGLADTELSEDLAYTLGRAYIHLLRKKNVDLEGKSIVVGYDMRPTSGPFHKALINGLTDEGFDVVNIGLATTPLFGFGCTYYDDHAAGIMVTASHNPAEYNGFKMTIGDGMPVGKGSGMEELRDMVERGEFGEVQAKGTETQKNIRDDYYARLFELVPKESIKPLKIVVDCANGMGSATFPQLLEQLPVEVEFMYLEPDGTFPNHEANPLKIETLQDLQKRVVEVGADFGFALDGDADRIGLVDEKGNVVEASYVGALVGLEILETNKQATMLYDLRSSQTVPDVWDDHGATTHKSKVGHANIKVQMRDTGATFASELSLHLYYESMHYLESTDLSLLYVMQLLSKEQKPLTEIIEPLKTYHHSGEHNFEIENKDEVMQRIHDTYKADAIEDLELDGIWMKFDWGWFSVRKSGTEPLLRLNLEARDAEIMQAKLAELTASITQ